MNLCGVALTWQVNVHVLAPLTHSKRQAPHNRKRRGEARVYGLIWPQRSLLF